MNLTEEEKNLVIQHRQKKVNRENIKNKQLACTHDFRIVGHSHNGDAYECTKCGKMEFY